MFAEFVSSGPDDPGADRPSEEWLSVLTNGHASLVRARHLFRYVPSAPRCKVCNNPFGGVGGRVFAIAGFRQSRKNPNLCTRCCDALPTGGASVDIAVLFADVRRSTALAERAGVGEFAALLNRFYQVATRALIRHDAVIDKLIGDEVMAFFVKGISGPGYRRQAVLAGIDLLRAVGYGARAPDCRRRDGRIRGSAALRRRLYGPLRYRRRASARAGAPLGDRPGRGCRRAGSGRGRGDGVDSRDRDPAERAHLPRLGCRDLLRRAGRGFPPGCPGLRRPRAERAGRCPRWRACAKGRARGADPDRIRRTLQRRVRAADGYLVLVSRKIGAGDSGYGLLLGAFGAGAVLARAYGLVFPVSIFGIVAGSRHELTHGEVFIVLGGNARFDVEGRSHELGAGDAICVPPKTWFAVSNEGAERFTAICCMAAGGQARIGDGEPFPIPWAQ
jgi:mannose-6-phosphate isomerase-like protein (cupin superfamily)